MNPRKKLGMEWTILSLVTVWFYSGEDFWNFILILFIIEFFTVTLSLVLINLNKRKEK